MKVLISGSAGFIYSNVVLTSLIETDWELVSVDKLTYAGSLLNLSHNSSVHNKRHRFYLGDVSDQHFVNKVFSIEKPDIVIHGAGESHVDNSIKGSSQFVQTNVLGSHVMLEAARLIHTPQKFFNISTDEVYGHWETAEGSSKETDPLLPRSPYSATKAGADLLGQSYYTTYGLPVITTRCSNNFGPRQHAEKFLPKAIINILTGVKVPVYGAGKQIRNWLYVKDHFNALRLLVEKGKPGEVYNIGSSDYSENINTLKLVCEAMGKNFEEVVEFVPDRLGHDFRYSVDTAKIKALGWNQCYKFEEALKHTVNWYKANTWFWKK